MEISGWMLCGAKALLAHVRISNMILNLHRGVMFEAFIWALSCEMVCMTSTWYIYIYIYFLDTGRLCIGDPDAALENMFMDMCAWAKSQGYKMPRGSVFSMSSLGRATSKSVYPELSSTFKAASVKTVCLYMAKKALDLHVPDDNHSKIRSTCAWAYANWLHTLDVSDRIFLPEQRDRAAMSARLFLLSYQALAEESISLNSCLYKVRPKHHDFDHNVMLFETGSLLNPRFLTCMSEEDLMGKLKLIGMKCSRQTASARILEWWLVTVDRRWKGLTKDWSLVARLIVVTNVFPMQPPHPPQGMCRRLEVPYQPLVGIQNCNANEHRHGRGGGVVGGNGEKIRRLADSPASAGLLDVAASLEP